MGTLSLTKIWSALTGQVANQWFWLHKVRRVAPGLCRKFALQAAFSYRADRTSLHRLQARQLVEIIQRANKEIGNLSEKDVRKPWWIFPGLRLVTRTFVAGHYHNLQALRDIAAYMAFILQSHNGAPKNLREAYESLRKNIYLIETGRESSQVALINFIPGQRRTFGRQGLAVSEAIKLERLSKGTWIYDVSQVNSASSSLEWFELGDAKIEPHGLVLSGDRAFFPHEGLAPWNHSYPGHRNFHSTTENPRDLLVAPHYGDVHQIDEAIFLPSRAPSNWFHWWFEVMSGLTSAREALPSEVPIIIAGAVPSSDVVPESFRSIVSAFVGNPIIYASSEQRFRVKKLFLRPPAIVVSDGFTVGHKKSVLGFSISDLESLRKSALRKARSVENRSPERIFLLRGKGLRAMLNEEQVVRVALKHGFDLIDPSELSWKDQVALFRDVRVIAGSGGAVMANYLFASAGAKIVQFVSDQNLAFQVPAILGSVAGAQVFSIAGQSKSLAQFSAVGLWQHASFHVPVDIVEASFARIVD